MKLIERTFNIKPLSINKAFQGRRFKTKDYKDYERSLHALGGNFERITGDVEVTFEWYLKNDKMTDIDNPTKCAMDYLTKAGAWEDDRKVRALHIYKYHSDTDYFKVKIKPYDRTD